MGLWERGWTEWVYQKPILPDELPNSSLAIGPRIPEQSEDKYGFGCLLGWLLERIVMQVIAIRM